MIPLFKPTIEKKEIQAIKRVIQTGWIGHGKETKLFEKEFGEKINSKYVLAVNSCTSAIYISMRLLNISKKDEVIIPSIHFVGCVNAILESGAKPIFADVDLNYLNIMPSEIERLRNEKTKAVILLHYGGHPCNMKRVYKYTKGLKIIEDSANSILSKYKEKNCGTLGDTGCFSFDSMKILSMGDGGAIVLKDKKLFKKAKEYRYLGLNTKTSSGLNALKQGETRWWEIELNSISNRNTTNDILSAIGRVQLKKLDKFIKRRKEIWQIYQENFSKLNWAQTPPEPLPNTKSSYYMYWLKLKDRDRFAKYLINNKIYCTFKYYPLHLIKYYQSNQTLPNAEKINKTTINIPLHQNLSDNEIEHIIKTIKKFKPS